MRILGIIAEYNPFHQGHIYHIEKAKDIVKPDLTIIVMSAAFTQRGEPAIIDKFTRARIAIDHGADLIIELPFVYTVQSADYFAKGAVMLLHEMGITDLCFGSEDGDIETLITIASAIKEQQERYETCVKSAMQDGARYPEACNAALKAITGTEVRTPNDLLGLAYVKEIINHDYPIALHAIKRTNDYHSLQVTSVASASALRAALKHGQDVSAQLPGYALYQNADFFTLDAFFPELRYIINFHDHLSSLHLVDEGLDDLLKKTINQVSSLDELINALTSRRYTSSRIRRMLIHILMNNTREDIKKAMAVDYIRLLGMSAKGQAYIKPAKQQTNFHIIANITKHQSAAIDMEMKAARLLSLKVPDYYQKEYQTIPYRKTVDH